MAPSTIRIPRPHGHRAALWPLVFAWTLPTNLLGHAAGWIASRGRGGHRIEAAAARATVYPVRIAWLGRRVVAVTLGNAILWHEPSFPEVRFRRLMLAHELAHTRQHDVLGPLYLPCHLVAQGISALTWLVRRTGRDPVHARNALENRWICLGFDAVYEIDRGERLDEVDVEELLRTLGA